MPTDRLFEAKNEIVERVCKDIDPLSQEGQGLLASLQAEIHEMEAWDSFKKRCERSHIGVFKVPGDGNCLIWSIRKALLGIRDVQPPESEESIEEMQTMRNALADKWLDVKGDVIWQELFQQLHVEQCETMPEKKKKLTEKEQQVRLETPPRPPQREKAKQIQRVGECKPVQTKMRSSDQELRKPSSKVKGQEGCEGLGVSDSFCIYMHLLYRIIYYMMSSEFH